MPFPFATLRHWLGNHLPAPAHRASQLHDPRLRPRFRLDMLTLEDRHAPGSLLGELLAASQMDLLSGWEVSPVDSQREVSIRITGGAVGPMMEEPPAPPVLMEGLLGVEPSAQEGPQAAPLGNVRISMDDDLRFIPAAHVAFPSAAIDGAQGMAEPRGASGGESVGSNRGVGDSNSGSVVVFPNQTESGAMIALPAPLPDTGIQEVSISAGNDANENGPEWGWYVVQRTSAVGELTVNVAVLGGTATSGVDFTQPGSKTTVTLVEGETDAFIFIAPVDDLTAEGAETVVAGILPGAGYIVNADSIPATISILDNDRTTGSGSIGGVLWLDPNVDGYRDTFGPDPVQPGVQVGLWDADLNYIAGTTTNSAGQYQFSGLADGSYFVDCPYLTYIPTLRDQGVDETRDSDADIDTGKAGPIAISGFSSNLSVDIGITSSLDLEPDLTPKRVLIVAPESKFVAENGVDVPADKSLRVAKWTNKNATSSAFGLLNGVAEVRPPNWKTRLDFIDEDPDRFNVYVFDPNAFKMKMPSVSVQLSTVNAVGSADYDDAPTSITLVQDRAPGQDGWYVSDSHILVSNQVDDEYNGYQVGIDEAGGGATIIPKHKQMYPLTDRTHKVALGGTVKVDYVANDMTTSAVAPVRVVKNVKVHATILNLPDGKAVITQNDATAAMRLANEQYAQVGIVLVPTFQIVNPPNNKVDLGNGLDGSPITLNATTKKIDMTAEEVELLSAFRTVALDDIELYFVNNFTDKETRRGEAFSASLVPEARFEDSVVIAVDKSTRFTIAHEIGHVLLNPIADANIIHYGGPLRGPNVMRSATSDTDAVTHSKRFTPAQRTTMLSARPNLLTGP